MLLEKRQCPNCGSNEVLEKDGTFVCMNCRTFFDNPNDLKITIKDEAKIEKEKTNREKIKADNEKIKNDYKMAAVCFLFVVIIIALNYLFIKK